MKKTKRFLTLVLALFMFFMMFNNNQQTEIKALDVKDEREFKAVWMSTFVGEAPYSNETQFKNDMTESLNILEHYGLNALIFHVRTHNNAFYKSELNPVASWWSGADFDVFDPLGWLIAETHKRGIEFHAWMNPYRVDTNRQSGVVPVNNPQNDSNNLIKGSTTILNPALPVVREHIYNTINEFVTIYPTVDAVHFDDYFYINTDVEPTSASARRAEIDKLIKGIHNVLKEFNNVNNTAIQFGISPTGIYRNGNGQVTYDNNGNPITDGSATRGFEHYGPYLYADTVKWAVEGWIDYLLPQTYWARNHSVASYTPLINWWNDVFKHLNVNLYSGLGVYMANNSGTYDWQYNMNELSGQFDIIDNLNKVEGYSIYSFKHLKNGYDNSTLKSGIQIRNGYNNPLRTKIRVLPEIRNMEPKMVTAVSDLTKNNNILTWSSVSQAKFYYIYQSNEKLTYSSDEIVAVIGHEEGLMSFDVSDYGSGNFGVRALSQTNHLSEVSNNPVSNPVTISFNTNAPSVTINPRTIEKGTTTTKPNDIYRENYQFLGWYLNDELFHFETPINQNITLNAKWNKLEVYNINYNLKGGSIITGYDNRDKMISDFLTDYYNFVKPDVDLQTFMHGANNSSNYDGLYNDTKYFLELYEANNKEIDPTTNKFINQREYNKWVPLFDLMDEYTNRGNSRQNFWSNPDDVGPFRIKPFIQKVNLWPYIDDGIILEITNRIPEEFDNIPIINDFTIIDNDIVLPDANKAGYKFLGWYDNPNFNGNMITIIPVEIKQNIDLYARWLELEKDKAVVSFDLGYSGLNLDSKIIDVNTSVIKPEDPIREGHSFLGWYLEDNIFDFNNLVNKDITLIAKWQIKEDRDVTVYFDLNYNEQWLPNIVLKTGNKVSDPYNPTRDNYEFKGWYLNGHLYDFNEPILNDIKLTAMWELDGTKDFFKVDFNLGYDDLFLSSETTLKGLTIEKPNNPLREGYSFLGWYDGKMKFDFNKPVYQDYTLIAHWQERVIIKDKIEVIDGASIRTLLHDDLQRLRFYGRVDYSLLNDEFGFYAIFGEASVNELKTKILENNDEIFINSKKVFKKKVNTVNKQNEFSLVLTGIPKAGYTDKFTIIAYALDSNNDLYLSKEGSTRSVSDVAYKMYYYNKSTEQSLNVLNYVNNNYQKLDYDPYGNLRITKGIYETNNENLKEIFLNDWNNLFQTNLVNPSSADFFESTKTGTNSGDRFNTNLSSTNIYKFFNDSFYKNKWGWFLNYLEEVDYTIHATGQIKAIKGNGTYDNPNVSSNTNRLYNASHLSYSIYNFFNNEDIRGNYTSIDFKTLNKHQDDNLNSLDRYNYVKEYNKNIYTDIAGVELFKIGDTIKLPIIKETPPNDSLYVYYDGIDYIHPLEDYEVKSDVVFEIKLIDK